MIKRVWDILSRRQDALVKDTFEGNFGAAIDAWHACTTSCRPNAPTKETTTDSAGGGGSSSSSSSREALSDAALRGWIGINLLGDPMGTFVEVREN